jgi:hypothetical protein
LRATGVAARQRSRGCALAGPAGHIVFTTQTYPSSMT